MSTADAQVITGPVRDPFQQKLWCPVVLTVRMLPSMLIGSRITLQPCHRGRHARCGRANRPHQLP